MVCFEYTAISSIISPKSTETITTCSYTIKTGVSLPQRARKSLKIISIAMGIKKSSLCRTVWVRPSSTIIS